MAEKKPWRDFIPDAPTIDFAYLKSYWPEVERRLPHVGKPGKMKRWTNGPVVVFAATKSEARAKIKKVLGVHRLPQKMLVVTK